MAHARTLERHTAIRFYRLCLGLFIAAAGLLPFTLPEACAQPAFITAGTVPNLLIIVDNSASMLELAYLPDSGSCHDDPESDPAAASGYETNRTYAGYFSTDTWYAYDTADERFEPAIKPSSCSDAGEQAYTLTENGVGDLCLQIDGITATMQAGGNFLNWLSASRFDIVKKALTGGKFDALAHTLISEGRGCPGTRYVRQVRVYNAATNTEQTLSLGIRSLDDGKDPTTAIEVFPPHPVGLSLEKCREALNALPLPDNSLATLQHLYEACAENGGSPLEPPRAVDPAGRLPHVGPLYDLPAVLTDIQAEEQLGAPLTTMRGIIHDPEFIGSPPRGILHEIADELRIGIMTFNHDGSRSECGLEGAAAEGDLLLDLSVNDCSTDSRDGGKVIVEIGDGTPGRMEQMVAAVNDLRADTWTPLAEAVFNAIGYFTQRMDMCINPGDFSTDNPPCTHWCQENSILVITDGVSTADLHPRMTTFASVEGRHDGTRDDAGGCPGLLGGTFLDDITAYGFTGDNIHLEDPFDAREHFQNIRTFFLVTGEPRSQGSGECAPATLLAEAAANGGSGAPYYTGRAGNVYAGLKSILGRIRSNAVSGAAASVFPARHRNGGAVYQAHFWPWLRGLHPTDPSVPESLVAWVGDVNALLVDEDGELFEDTDASGSLSAADKGVVFYRDPDSGETRLCLQEPAADGSCQGLSQSIGETAFLWSAAAWLADIEDADILTNRLEYLSSRRQRYIFTWNDLDNNGAVGDGEILPFTPMEGREAVAPPAAADRAPVCFDFGVTSAGEVNDIISWVRGLDSPGNPHLRSRQAVPPPNFGDAIDTAHITWRLGDVIHSTPTVVAAPSENYHLRYGDEEYAAFFTANVHRRQVIYFGGNDGMVHAVNGGFYDEANRTFRRGYDHHTGVFSDAGPDLGAELWAYVPYNLLPHLKALMRPDYRHTYYVDATPRAFDVQIFESTPNRLGHVDGWGTILVVGMRLGGDKVRAQDIVDALSSGTYTDDRVFASAYMVFDISDPEIPPRLLGELTYDPKTSAALAYTSATPAVVPVKSGDRGSDWFLVLGSGPTDPAGFSDQHALVGVFPLKALSTGQAFRIPAATAWSHASAGSSELASSPDGFVSGMTVADYDLESHYKADVIYFGTVEGRWAEWGGRMYRWVTTEGYPQSWCDPEVMFDARLPITAAPGLGFDGTFYWIYFGTGRFFDPRDRSDPAGQGGNCFFGIKEPVDAATGAFTWARVENNPATTAPQPGNDAGSRTILRVDQIRVEEGASPSTARLHCADGSACLPYGVSTFKALKKHIVGRCDPGTGCTGTDGWVLALPEERERVLGSNTLLGGLLTFTTYRPFEDICRPEGDAFYYGVHYQTGTAYWEPVFSAPDDKAGTSGTDGSPQAIATRISIGQGFVTTPSLYLRRQQGMQALIGTGSGAIVAVPLSNLPLKTTRSGRSSWRRY